jgi:hypothetical protein
VVDNMTTITGHWGLGACGHHGRCPVARLQLPSRMHTTLQPAQLLSNVLVIAIPGGAAAGTAQAGRASDPSTSSDAPAAASSAAAAARANGNKKGSSPAAAGGIYGYLSGAKRALARSLLGFAIVVPEGDRGASAAALAGAAPRRTTRVDEASQIFGDEGDYDAGGDEGGWSSEGDEGEEGASEVDSDAGGDGDDASSSGGGEGPLRMPSRVPSRVPLRRYGTLKRVEHDEEWASAIGGCWIGGWEGRHA